MINDECFYCSRDEQLGDLMIEIHSMKISTLYLLRDQTYKGRCVLALNSHKTELFQLTEEERTKFMDDVAKASEMIYQSFNANKINYAIYGDLVSHLHFHLVPKYRDGEGWGKQFDNSPEYKKILSDQQYQEIIEELLRN